MTQPKRSTILIISNGSPFIYLIQRYADRTGSSVTVVPPSVSPDAICHLKPAAVIFSSVGDLEQSQSLVARLANCDIPILVCSSMTDQTRTRDLGADYCLLHPLSYDDFQTALSNATGSKRV